MSLIFIGDIMGHGTQIDAAYDTALKDYNYNPVFEIIAPVMGNADFTIANLEVTLAGKPYSGYPQFSSPDELAVACKNNGIDVLVTANNHSVDRGGKGMVRTIKVLDSLNIPHTGTFKDSLDRLDRNLLILQKGNIRVGVLNYTYGTNGLTVAPPISVNRIDSSLMKMDIDSAKTKGLDKLVVVMHWGKEYEAQPNKYQTNYAQFLFENGVDIIIGSHPHVLERMEYHTADSSLQERFIVYSLGNFVSNQRTIPRDGGAMVKLELTKIDSSTQITNRGYYLTWVNKPKVGGKRKFQILPVYLYDEGKGEGISDDYRKKMKVYSDGARLLMNENNIGVEEIVD
jgi:poly-gamma-glutamate synthesis protein (capsule biosynthesis protein)